MGRWQSSRATRGTVMQRCHFIEESMLQNLQEMREYRLGIDEVQQRRKADARRFMEEFKQKPENIKLSDLQPAPTLDPAEPRPRDTQSMKDRISAVELNMESNQEALDGHRKVLNGILAVRQEAEQRRAQSTAHAASGSAALAAAARQGTNEDVEVEDMQSTSEKCRDIQRNARFMGSAMQKAAVSKARTDDAKEKAAMLGETMLPTRQTSADGNTPSRTPSFNTDARRPQSAMSTSRHGQTRPMSAASTRASRPVSAVSRPMSAMSRGTSSGRSSRPSSANSLTARFRNIQESVERNQEMLQSHRNGIDMVVKMRQERAQKMTTELLASIKEMYEKKAAERNPS